MARNDRPDTPTASSDRRRRTARSRPARRSAASLTRESSGLASHDQEHGRGGDERGPGRGAGHRALRGGIARVPDGGARTRPARSVATRAARRDVPRRAHEPAHGPVEGALPPDARLAAPWRIAGAPRRAAMRPSSTSPTVATASSALASARRMPSPVIGSMKPAASPSEEQPGASGHARVDGERAEDARPGGGHGARETAGPSTGSARSRAASSASGAGHAAVPRRARLHEAGVGAAIGGRRDAEVVTVADVHLAERGQARDAVEVGADGPASRAWRAPRQPARFAEPGAAAIGAERDTRAEHRAVDPSRRRGPARRRRYHPPRSRGQSPWRLRPAWRRPLTACSTSQASSTSRVTPSPWRARAVRAPHEDRAGAAEQHAGDGRGACLERREVDVLPAAAPPRRD